MRSLDERWLPVAAARVRRWADLLQHLQERRTRAARAVSLRALDERWSRGPLGIAGRHPALALLLAGALLAAGTGVALDWEHSHPARSHGPGRAGPGPSYGGMLGATLGPVVGADVEGYLAAATQGLVGAAQASPASARVALVSQTTYLTPEGAKTLLTGIAGIAVTRVFLRAPAAGRDATPFPVEVRGDLLRVLRSVYAETARARAAAATSYRSYAASLKGSGSQDKTFRDLYVAFARASALEARAYAGDCACVYAALVVATPSQLLALRDRPGVRAVEVAAAGLTASQVQVQPLRPDVSGNVPRPTVNGPS